MGIFNFRNIIKLYSLHFRSSIRDALENPGGQPVTAKRAKQKGYSLLEKVTIVFKKYVLDSDLAS